MIDTSTVLLVIAMHTPLDYLARTRHGIVSDWLSVWVSGLPGVR